MNGHFTGNDSISPGTVVSIIILAIITICCIGVFLLGLILQRSDDSWNEEFGMPLSFGAPIVLILFYIGFGIGMFPYGYDYHHYREYSGVVSKIDSRLLDSGNDSTNQKFVVEYKGGQDDFACDDTRCALIKPGDTLTLTCKLTFQWNGASGEDCNFVSKLNGPQ